MGTFIVLLRAIGPATHKLMSMAQWREAALAAGFREPQTYVATGNMIVEADGSASAVRKEMKTIVESFGLTSEVFVVTPAALTIVLKADPFPDASAARPSEVAVYFFGLAEPDFSWVAAYDGPEPIRMVGAQLVVDYSGRTGTSLRLPGTIEKRSGTATARNWNTVRGLAERAASRMAGSN
jgi:uncharacterized protein (DUF1697 family)